ncbi:MAG TPA: GNAT family N-acetyltransferase [Xanthobacteraceae bacterium]|nr:GNAT family N-acetyltransferase [Xanthobacteraceae bacterium]
MQMHEITATNAPAIVGQSDGLFRKLLPGDRAAFLDHLLRLDPLSRFTRFGAPVNDAALSRHAARTFAGEAMLFGYFVEDELRGVAELHPLPARTGRPLEAEAAFSVERPWQGRGIGSRLMRQLLLLAQNRNIQNLHVVFLAINGRMKRLAVRQTANLQIDDNEVVALLHAPRATPFSRLREWTGDVFTVLAMAADLQSRLLPPSLRGN